MDIASENIVSYYISKSLPYTALMITLCFVDFEFMVKSFASTSSIWHGRKKGAKLYQNICSNNFSNILLQCLGFMLCKWINIKEIKKNKNAGLATAFVIILYACICSILSYGTNIYILNWNSFNSRWKYWRISNYYCNKYLIKIDIRLF